MEAIINKYKTKAPASAALLDKLPAFVEKKLVYTYLDYGMSSQTQS